MQHGLFTRKFSGGVVVQRIWGVHFRVRRFFCAVKNVVRSVVDEPDAVAGTKSGEQLRRGGVDRPRKFALDFTAVHEVVGGGIDDGVRLQFREPARHQISPGDVKLSVAGKEKLKIRRRDFLERVRQQTIAACDEYVFHNRSSREA